MDRRQLTTIEMETIINYDDSNDNATVYTHNLALQRKLDKFCKSHPEIYSLIKENKQWGSKTYLTKKKYITLRVPKKLSEDTLKRLKSGVPKPHCSGMSSNINSTLE